MNVTEELWGDIPLLHIVEDELKDKQVPVVIFIHGFMSAKEHNLHYAYNMAKKGIRVLLPDAHLHGARDENLDEVQMSLRFWEVVLTSIEEVGFIRQELMQRGLHSTGEIGLGGTSMGGITTLGCLTVYEWIDAASVMMGAPGFVQLAKAQMSEFERNGFTLPVTEEEKKTLFATLSTFDLTKHPAALNNRPVYFWHGKKDSVVPYEPTRNFIEAVKKDYAAVPDRIEFISDGTAGHAVSRSGMLKAADWLAVHLK
ncbi:prolyl oligopeptidase family serine peptidase [Sporosarcina sp. ANT_H38]|uniref:prolyl oligopeptidase family serine peptidase n=1 Tax=Sporosarcina sp. ANT_H38 TaxID=2597358 RepID=UPI0011F362F0|nr:prolyl oligopeptidase family serine peptidase [Sporosarcina sp. ANT_H38]KAA0966741.1 prolyl oligopeptidase family serine peptidase [Sporosarcina sp. ANT_H38]